MSETAETVRQILFDVLSGIPEFEYLDPAQIPESAAIEGDLFADSLDAVEIEMAMEKAFGFEPTDPPILEKDCTVGELIAAVRQARGES